MPATRSLAAFKLEQYRRAATPRMTKAALAAELGVSAVAVIFWENGRSVPRHDMQGKLHERGICSPNEWHLPAPAEDDQQSAA